MKAKTIVLLLSFTICLFGFLGCSSPKNLTSSTKETGKTEEKRSEVTTGEISSFIDSTKTAGLEVKYFKIEFYPPEEQPENTGPEPGKEPTAGNTNNEPKPTNKKPPDKGAIKSIEGLVISSSSEEKGVTETQEKNTSQKEEEINTDNTLEENIEEETAEDPYKWRYIFGTLIAIIIICIAGYFLLRKTKLFGLIKKLF